jgi:hypothetical protein
MPHMTDEPVRAGSDCADDLWCLHEVSMKTAVVSYFEICYPVQDLHHIVLLVGNIQRTRFDVEAICEHQ